MVLQVATSSFSTSSLLSHVFLPFVPCGLWHQKNHLHGVLKRQSRELIQFEICCYKSSSLFPAAFQHSAMAVCTGWVHRVEVRRMREGRKIDRTALACNCFVLFKYYCKYGFGHCQDCISWQNLFFFLRTKILLVLPLNLVLLVPLGIGKKNPCI